MKAVVAYMATKNAGDSNEMRHGESNGEHGEMRRGEAGIEPNWTQNDYDGVKSRYRGRDGRWKAGRRKSEMETGMDEGWEKEMPEDARVYEERNEYRKSRYHPEYPIAPMNAQGGLYDGGGIGFATRDKQYETRNHYGSENMQRQSARVGGTMWLEPQENDINEKLDRVTAEKWVRSLKSEDTTRPTGGRWTMEELKPMAQKFGLKTGPDDEEFIEFYAMTNAMYSDYCNVAQKFNITSPEYYGMMALAWMRDKDAVSNKTVMYYECCVKK